MKKRNNRTLNSARESKKDEFYTHYGDISDEMNLYRDYFKGKIVYCNCDNPYESNFFRFFVVNFNLFGISELRATCCMINRVSVFELGKRAIQEKHGLYAIVRKVDQKSVKGRTVDFDSLFSIKGNSISELSGNGDFKSDECREILRESDVVVTNPPFSLMRRFVRFLIKNRKEFIIIGPITTSTDHEIIKGFANFSIRFDRKYKPNKFYIPDNYLDFAKKYNDEDGRTFVKLGVTRWIVSISGQDNPPPFKLTKRYVPDVYHKYDNYDAIDVPVTRNIPIDFEGTMGVPITFFDHFSPDQFRIVGFGDNFKVHGKNAFFRILIEKIGNGNRTEDSDLKTRRTMLLNGRTGTGGIFRIQS